SRHHDSINRTTDSVSRTASFTARIRKKTTAPSNIGMPINVGTSMFPSPKLGGPGLPLHGLGSVMAITKWPITLAVIAERLNWRIKRQAKRFREWRKQQRPKPVRVRYWQSRKSI